MKATLQSVGGTFGSEGNLLHLGKKEFRAIRVGLRPVQVQVGAYSGLMKPDKLLKAEGWFSRSQQA